MGRHVCNHRHSRKRTGFPPFDQWPDLPQQGFDYPEYLNCAVELTDRLVEKGYGDVMKSAQFWVVLFCLVALSIPGANV